MKPVLLSSAVSAVTTLAALGYSLPDWFLKLMIICSVLLSISFLYSLPRLFIRILGSFKSDDNSDTKPE